MKIHPQPVGRLLTKFPVKVDVYGDEWTYMVTHDATYLRPPTLDQTIEASYYEITGRMPPHGVCPPPSEDAINRFLMQHFPGKHSVKKFSSVK